MGTKPLLLLLKTEDNNTYKVANATELRYNLQMVNLLHSFSVYDTCIYKIVKKN